MQESNEEDHNNPLVYSIDNSILMQRDAHFAGSFPLMIEYYQKEGRGMLNEIELSRIEELYEIEQRDGVNLSAVMLSGAEMEKIAEWMDRAVKAVEEESTLAKINAEVTALCAKFPVPGLD